MTKPSPKAQRLANVLRKLEDLPTFAERCLKIRTKKAGIKPLIFNAAQQRLHAAIEDQKRRTGMVRMLVPKARQWGCSTYVEAREYHNVIFGYGLRGFILTNSADGTEAIFEMAKRFHDLSPKLAKPAAGKSNAKELAFPGIDSGIEVGTAGTAAVGRGRTIQFFHGSEVAYWPNAGDHIAGILQAVPRQPGTEVIFESSANGMSGPFYAMCQAARKGEGEFELCFVPWFWHVEEYTAEPPPDWQPTKAWAKYGNAHALTPGQLYWAWNKNGEFARALGASADAPCAMFHQEYPASIEDAFQSSKVEGFIKPDVVMAARKRTIHRMGYTPIVLGVDVARGGGDKTHIIDREGRRAGHLCNEVIDVRDLMVVTGAVKNATDRLGADAVFVDVTGLGAGVVDRLRELGYKNVHGVNFGARAEDNERYFNKRAEIWGRVKDWFEDAAGADLVDDDTLQGDLCAPGAFFDSASRTRLEPKEDIKKRVGSSPDGGDALALTFAETVRKAEDRDNDVAMPVAIGR